MTSLWYKLFHIQGFRIEKNVLKVYNNNVGIYDDKEAAVSPNFNNLRKRVSAEDILKILSLTGCLHLPHVTDNGILYTINHCIHYLIYILM